MVRRTWAPRGRTPILRHLGHRDKVSALSGISVSPRRRRLGLYIRFFENRNVKAPNIIAFLRQLLRHLGGRIIVIWDRGRPHTAGETKRFLHRSRRRLSTESFPSYAPDLNPDEHVWALLKNHRLANHGFNTLQRLHQHLLYHAGRTGRSQNLLWGCIRASELPMQRP